jgi:hypothetical protein
MSSESKERIGFTPKEISMLRVYAVIVAAIAAGMLVVAPKGLGQILGLVFAGVLLPVPPVTIYLVRRRKLRK